MSKSKRIPKYRLHKSSGQAIVTLAGKDFYLGKYDTPESRERYDQLISEWLTSGRCPTSDQIMGGPSVSEVCLAFWKHAQTYYRSPDNQLTRTVERIKLAIRYLRPSYGGTLAKDFGPLALQAFRQKLVDKGFARRYVNNLVGTIKLMFKWAASQELVPIATYQALATVSGLRKGRTPAPEPKPIPPVADEVVEQTLPHLPPIVADMVRIQRLIGCRPGEIVIVRPMDIDRSGDIWFYSPPSHKTAWREKNRIIPIGPRAQAILMPYLDRPEEFYCFSPREGQALRFVEMRRMRKSIVQPSQKSRKKKKPKKTPGKKYDTRTYGRAVTSACKRHGIQHWSPNQLRKAAAVTVRETFDLEHAKSVLGHHETTTTEQFYADKDLRRAIEVAKKIG